MDMSGPSRIRQLVCVSRAIEVGEKCFLNVRGRHPYAHELRSYSPGRHSCPASCFAVKPVSWALRNSNTVLRSRPDRQLALTQNRPLRCGPSKPKVSTPVIQLDGPLPMKTDLVQSLAAENIFLLGLVCALHGFVMGDRLAMMAKSKTFRGPRDAARRLDA